MPQAVKFNPQIFREYDLRGKDSELTDAAVQAIGSAYATMLRRKNKGAKFVTVGRDIRTSSERIKNALVRGITACGIDVIDLGLSPTPMLYYSIIKLKSAGGINVTGSHNPVGMNGLKINIGEVTIYGGEIQKLREMIENSDFDLTEAGKEGNATEKDLVQTYIDEICSRVKLKRKLKIVVDAGNGMASEIAPKLLRKLGCEVIPLYCKLDGTFPNHLPDPTQVPFVQDLIALVKSEKADLGLGFDGDVDRTGVIDENGKIVWADRIMMLFAREILSREKGAQIIFDVKCSQALPEVIEANGGRPLMWKTGHSLSKAKLRETGAPISGEMSGHIFFKDRWLGFDDGFYVAARFLEILAAGNKTVSEIMGEFPEYFSTPEIRLDYSEEKKFEFVEK
ncbi:phosphomannomutase/phosphoglucomutase, partial [Candidatus Micrarchaeota archaeon]|nr:phosphomannomutase/phosphoglucomutase [Candidatus Micrarchaeota archaeon]